MAGEYKTVTLFPRMGTCLDHKESMQQNDFELIFLKSKAHILTTE